MMKSPDKLTVLRLLREKNATLSMPELMLLLDERYAERTVRRWLGEWITAGKVVKLGQKRGTRYRISLPDVEQTTENRQESLTAETSPFSKKNIEIIQQVRQPLYKRMPKSYHPDWIKEYVPNKTPYISKEILTELKKAGQKIPDKAPAGTYARHIYNRILIDISYHSSRLEGNTYSLIDTERLLIDGASAEGKLDEEKIMILNHKEAIRYLVANAATLEIDQDSIFTLHYLLADGLVPVQYAGKIRDYGVRISGSTYVPVENPKKLVNYFNIICKKARLIREPYEQSLFLLIHLAYLQAFVDVNKRTARLAANIPLLKYNLVPLSFNDIEKEDYSAAMIAVYELNDIRPLLELYIYSYLRTCQLYDVTVESVDFDEVRVRYRKQRRDIIRFIIMNELSGKEMLEYIQNQSKDLITAEDNLAFINDIDEDLREISPQRIAGLGVTIDQLNKWLVKQQRMMKR